MAESRKRLARTLHKRDNFEHLTTLLLLSVIEISVSLEFPYWVLAVIITTCVLSREGSLVLMFAEEVEIEVEREVAQLRGDAQPVPVPARE